MALLENVHSVKLLVEYVNGDEEVWIDNVRLTIDPEQAYTSCLSSTFNAGGIEDWSFEGGGIVTIDESGGNGGGCLSIENLWDEASWGLPPSRFTGDWTELENVGFLAFDWRIISESGPRHETIDLVKISGPGGEAKVTIADSDLPQGNQYWQDYVFPLEESVWTLVSGTWDALLADVTEVRVSTEVIDGAETIGIDNFQLSEGDCEAPDNPVEIIPGVTGIQFMAMTGQVGAHSSNFNLVDEFFYSLVKLFPEVGGGLHRVTGEDAGERIATFDRPADVISVPEGFFFVTEDYGGDIFRVDLDGNVLVWIDDIHAGDDDTYGLAVAPAGFDGPQVSPGDILVTDRGWNGEDGIYFFDPEVINSLAVLVADPGDVEFFDLAATSAGGGRVYTIEELSDNPVQRLFPDGTLEPLELDLPSAFAPRSLAIDDVTGDLYVGCDDLVGESDRIYRTSIYEPLRELIPVELVAEGFTRIARCGMHIASAQRRLWVTDESENRIYEFLLSNGVGVDEGPAPAPLAVRTWPNPANPSVSISFSLAEMGWVDVEIFDPSGRRVRRLISGTRAMGLHSIQWDGSDDDKQPLPSGLYLVRVRTQEGNGGARVTILR